MENNMKEYNGIIEIQGKIFLDQFYTLGGESDADTVKINLTMDAVRFRKNKNMEWQNNIRVLFDAFYIDRDQRKRIVKNINHNPHH
jgi:hypothetical protein